MLWLHWSDQGGEPAVEGVLGSGALASDAASPTAGAEAGFGQGSPTPVGTTTPCSGGCSQAPAPCPVWLNSALRTHHARHRQCLPPSAVAPLTGEFCRTLLSGAFPSCPTSDTYFEE